MIEKMNISSFFGATDIRFNNNSKIDLLSCRVSNKKLNEIIFNNDLALRAGYMSTVELNISENLTAATKLWTAPISSTYFIQFWSNSSTPHDLTISVTGDSDKVIASQYAAFTYFRLNSTLTIVKNTAIKFSGAIGDSLIIYEGK